MSVFYFIAAFVIVAALYWALYRLFVPKLIRETTGKLREWADASKVFTLALAAYVEPGDEISAARERLERAGFKDFSPTFAQPGLCLNRYKLPLLFSFALPLRTWTVETRVDDSARVSAVRGIAASNDRS